MNRQIDLLDQMQKIAGLLVENATLLCQQVRKVPEEKELEKLQLRQHELLAELAMADSLLKNHPAEENEEVRLKKAQFQKELEKFQQVNKQFFELLSIRFRVIQP
jgi:hypothetical protein